MYINRGEFQLQNTKLGKIGGWSKNPNPKLKCVGLRAGTKTYGVLCCDNFTHVNMHNYVRHNMPHFYDLRIIAY